MARTNLCNTAVPGATGDAAPVNPSIAATTGLPVPTSAPGTKRTLIPTYKNQ